MTDRAEIIRMASEAGYETDMFGFGVWDSADFNRFAALVAAAEREACAKLCDPYTHGQWFAKAIRARGEK
jgi:hypothetical protein